MTKLTFLAKLEKKLSSLPKAEKNKATSYYSEMIDDMIESGYEEELAVEKIGDPSVIAKKYLLELNYTEEVVEEKKDKKPSTGKKVVGICFKMLFAVIFILLALWIASLASYYVVSFAKSLIESPISSIAYIGFTLTLAGLTILFASLGSDFLKDSIKMIKGEN